MKARVAHDLSVRSSPGPVLGSLCTGYGGLDLGVLAAFGGGRIAWCADHDPEVREILTARMPGVPNLGDLRLVDWTGVDRIDVLAVGFPCQEISAAGQRKGIEKGTRSGVWIDVVACIRVLRPQFIIVENVAALRWRNGGLHRVLGDLAEAGYDAVWRSVRASDVGAPHRRERVFLLAWPTVSDTASARRRQPRARGSRSTPCPRPPGEPARRRQRDACSGSASTALQAQVDAVIQGSSSSTPPLSPTSWCVYSDVVARWEHSTGRATPHPTVPGTHGGPVLSPAFVEHLMGLPSGWVTDVPLLRVDHLRILGNGAVLQQAAHAVTMLLDDFHEVVHASTRGRAA
ncbi:DNA cytosine methyltransferase [Lentzea sp. BCCO 10_0061]|uniref:DNA (cytosine-5-)-methyltransferase n=1 Tax=Lentzea sokolovensis TaxID=3095429 RepID=A0ABU4V9C2_9PSEU|nr:DNA cytosine methyltransferase [Lentzea sp. BCCO 10_0061]MDX8148392.1 DNA cytosine methyltransferase [Lentzea sp. BCCO 10_0061]